MRPTLALRTTALTALTGACRNQSTLPGGWVSNELLDQETVIVSLQHFKVGNNWFVLFCFVGMHLLVFG